MRIYELFLEGHPDISDKMEIPYVFAEDLIEFTNGFKDKKFISMLRVRDTESEEVVTLEEFKKRHSS